MTSLKFITVQTIRIVGLIIVPIIIGLALSLLVFKPVLVNHQCSSIDANFANIIPTIIKFSLLIVFSVIISGLLLFKYHPDHHKESFYYAIAAIFTCILIYIIFAMAELYGIFGVSGLPKNSSSYDLVYFSAITMTTVGYGEIYPCPASRPLAAIQGLSSLFVFPILTTLYFKSISLD